jgi:signal transduction histidine kinase
VSTLQLTSPPVSRPYCPQTSSTVPGVARRITKSVGPPATRWNAKCPSAVQPRGSPRTRSTSSAVSAAASTRRLDLGVANLVGNALRHGARPVRVRLDVNGSVTAERTAVIEVRDSGPGIPDSVRPHVFERFYKSDTARIRSEGSGLGLSITAENVRIHGGTVRAPNHRAGGAVFTVELPLRRDEETQEHRSRRPS